jgi:hypothetical protein
MMDNWKGVFQELVAVRANELQLSPYLAVMAGARRSLDDWISPARLDDYRRLMTRLGLVVEIDCVFRPLPEEGIFGVDIAPTTRAVGASFPQGADGEPNSTVHVIVSSRPDWASETLAAAWYPLAIGGRIVAKPKIDHLRLGRAFGYPECCVNSFMRNNNWASLNTLYESSRVTHEFRWQTNCLPTLTPWILVFHMPCSFDCPATCEQAVRTIEAIRSIDPDYAARIVSYLRQTFLSINERVCFVLHDAKTTGKSTTYSGMTDIHFLKRNVQSERERKYGAALARGDAIRIEDGLVYVYSAGRLRETMETRCDLGVTEFPFLLTFS